MERWRGLDQIPPGWGRCVLTIGVFDGVHRGHQAMIAAAVARGRDLRLPVVLLTFDPHPAEVVRPGSHPAELTTLRRRAELVDHLGVDVFLVVPFTTTLQSMSAEEFVHDVMVDRLHSASVVVGENFRFGHRGLGSLALLTQLGGRFGFSTTGLPLITDEDVTISSTYIRACIAAGDVGSARTALGRWHRLEGFVVRGEGRGGTELGYPTANLDVTPNAAVPADGIYAGWFVLGANRYPTAMSIGTNPTFSGRERTVEAFVLDEDANYYGRRVALEFVERLRAQIRYESVDALIAQIDQDVAQTREVLALRS